MLFPDGAESVDRDTFAERLCAIEYATAMVRSALQPASSRVPASSLTVRSCRLRRQGPKGIVRPEEATPSAEAVDAFWQFLVEGSSASSELSFDTMRARLQDMSLDENRDGAVGEGPDSVVWKGFALALGCKPFDRF